MGEVRQVIVGDVHGCIRPLKEVVTRYESERRFVFLGDLVNFGPSSKEVLDLVLRLECEGRADVLLGNHEVEFLRYYDVGDLERFALRGGIPTIRSYVGEAHGNVHQQFCEAVPSAHIDMLRRAQKSLVRGKHLLVHDGGSLAGEGMVVICGHSSTGRSGGRVSDRLVCLDIGRGAGGPLRVCLLPEEEVEEYSGGERS